MPTVTPRLRALCVSLATAVAVVFIRLAYSASTEPLTSLLAMFTAWRKVMIRSMMGAMAAMLSSPNSKEEMELRSSGRTRWRACSTRMTAPIASVWSCFCRALGSICKYL